MASAAAAVQTFVLRVSIHCHGCKKKVRKVLRNIEGVHDVKVDAAAHKVIVTGTVDAETLVKKLQKSGKQALPWQYPPAAPAKSPEEAAPPAAEEAPPAVDGGKNNDAAAASAEDDGKKPEEPAKEAQSDGSEKKPEQEAAAAAEEKKADGDAEKETEPEKKAETEEAKPSEEAQKEGGKSEAAEPVKEAGNDGATEKKSKPKETAAAAATVDRSLQSFPPPVPMQGRYEGYNSPPQYYAPQPVMSYNMAQPRASQSHYAPLPEQGYSMHQQPPPAPYSSSFSMQQHAYSQQPQPMQQWSPSYLYMPYPHASPESYHDYYSPPGTHAPPPMQDSYRIFDDENPNSCSVM